ncbi:MAG: NAD(P)H-quinone oxidoreductase subunit F [Leptolyngbyaceae bacterium]|nr:NAD(P)H-quinone oxidoreductase subunit F [Leptolyngbyaceae bacterium]
MAQFLLQTSWLIPLYGLAGALLTLPWSLGLIRRTGPRPAAYLNIITTILGFAHGALALNYIWNVPVQALSFSWWHVADLNLVLDLELSPVSVGALELVTGISLLAQIFALGYMEKDASLARFFGLMGLFEAGLSGLALSDSLLLSYGCLEVLTLSTYLLVGFWYAQPLVVTAARDAFLTKRVGDIALLMGVVALSAYGEGLSFSDLGAWAATAPLGPFAAALVGLSLIAGPTGKCAQFPLNLWLDEAMEGPNPAGILRNSIVVSAGAYVLIKLEPVFTLSPISADALIIIGSVTAIGTSLMALAQIDIKRALSHSTSAWMGLIFIAVGLGQVDIAFLLLFTHAVSKALMFMSIGSVVLNTSNQNITEMGGLWSRMPLTTLSFVLGGASIVALLPLGAFWTMNRWFDGSWMIPWWLLLILSAVNFFNALNFVRVFRLVFGGQPQAKTRRSPEAPWPMAVPMVALSIIVLLVPTVPVRWSLWLSTTAPLDVGDLPMVPWSLPVVMVAGLAGAIVGLGIHLNRSWARPRNVTLRLVQDTLAYDFYLENIYDLTVVWLVGTAAKITTWFDRYVVDGVVNLVGLATVLSGQALRYSISGQSQGYILTITVSLGILFILTMAWMSLLA